MHRFLNPLFFICFSLSLTIFVLLNQVTYVQLKAGFLQRSLEVFLGVIGVKVSMNDGFEYRGYPFVYVIEGGMVPTYRFIQWALFTDAIIAITVSFMIGIQAVKRIQITALDFLNGYMGRFFRVCAFAIFSAVIYLLYLSLSPLDTKIEWVMHTGGLRFNHANIIKSASMKGRIQNQFRLFYFIPNEKTKHPVRILVSDSEALLFRVDTEITLCFNAVFSQSPSGKNVVVRFIDTRRCENEKVDFPSLAAVITEATELSQVLADNYGKVVLRKKISELF